MDILLSILALCALALLFFAMVWAMTKVIKSAWRR